MADLLTQSWVPSTVLGFTQAFDRHGGMEGSYSDRAMKTNVAGNRYKDNKGTKVT